MSKMKIGRDGRVTVDGEDVGWVLKIEHWTGPTLWEARAHHDLATQGHHFPAVPTRREAAEYLARRAGY